MNKAEFIDYISKKQDCTKVAADKMIDVFTSSVTGALGAGLDVNLIGFGAFSVTRREARTGRNPKTGLPIQIAASNQPGFKAGKSLKDACNVVK